MRKIISIVLVLFLMLWGLPALAQESTEPAPVEEPITPPSEPAPFNLVHVLVSGIIGAVAGVSGVLAAVGRIKNDKATLDAIEWAGKNIPVEGLLEIINALGRNMKDAGDVIDKISDGKPNDSPALSLKDTARFVS